MLLRSNANWQLFALAKIRNKLCNHATLLMSAGDQRRGSPDQTWPFIRAFTSHLDSIIIFLSDVILRIVLIVIYHSTFSFVIIKKNVDYLLKWLEGYLMKHVLGVYLNRPIQRTARRRRRLAYCAWFSSCVCCSSAVKTRWLV